jgi:hypothetical protein
MNQNQGRRRKIKRIIIKKGLKTKKSRIFLRECHKFCVNSHNLLSLISEKLLPIVPIKEKIMTIAPEIIDQLLGNASSEEDLFGADGLVRQLSKQLLDRMLEAELTHTLGHEKHEKGKTKADNYRNGKTSKTIKTANGDLAVNIPRDRNGEHEPTMIKKPSPFSTLQLKLHLKSFCVISN